MADDRVVLRREELVAGHQPIAPNVSSSDRRKNRRVEIKVYPAEAM